MKFNRQQLQEVVKSFLDKNNSISDRLDYLDLILNNLSEDTVINIFQIILNVAQDISESKVFRKLMTSKILNIIQSPLNAEPLEICQRKEKFLQVELASCADSESKFKIMSNIEECQKKIRELRLERELQILKYEQLEEE